MLFEYDYSMCGNSKECPKRDTCMRAINLPSGIYTVMLFYNKNKECENYLPKENN
jgi:hypothetical protein